MPLLGALRRVELQHLADALAMLANSISNLPTIEGEDLKTLIWRYDFYDVELVVFLEAVLAHPSPPSQPLPLSFKSPDLVISLAKRFAKSYSPNEDGFIGLRMMRALLRLHARDHVRGFTKALQTVLQKSIIQWGPEDVSDRSVEVWVDGVIARESTTSWGSRARRKAEREIAAKQAGMGSSIE
ncbi:hypothetical protein HDV00_000997 [Rhizophlyctis rosea]|nr:hypothetical protein HDV00_000997 [Rhizophlyctis rosea]